MKTRTIRQTTTIPAKPMEVYDALMTSRGHSAFTGAPALVNGKVGGSFVAWDEYIHGTNIELVPGKKIVQAWRPTEESWPQDYFSRVTFDLVRIPNGTRIRFTHSGVLAEHAGHLADGWKEHYWKPLRRYFSTKNK